MPIKPIHEHLQPGYDYTDGMTPHDMLQRLKEFAMYGLDECMEVDQLVECLEMAVGFTPADNLFGNHHPMFVMSMYGDKESLLEAKAKYYMEECDRLDARLTIDTLNPNRRQTIVDLVAENEDLKEQLRQAELTSGS